MNEQISAPPSLAKQFGRAVLWVFATILVTLVLMALSSASGGFAASRADAETGTMVNRWSVPIMVHLATVLTALVLGCVIMLVPKGTALHRLLGRIYCAALLTTAVASFWIGEPGTGIAGSGFSFIHAFSVWTLITIPLAVRAVRAGKVETHESMMRGLFIGLLIAGLISFIPGRLLGNLVF